MKKINRILNLTGYYYILEPKTKSYLSWNNGESSYDRHIWTVSCCPDNIIQDGVRYMKVGYLHIHNNSIKDEFKDINCRCVKDK